MYKIQTLNKISAKGLSCFPLENYEIASEFTRPDAILVRSCQIDSQLPSSVKAIARAGAGVNNIPLDDMNEKGIVVFNTPGANANAVKELVTSALFFSSRPVIQAHQWVHSLVGQNGAISDILEKSKSQFIGPEIMGKTLGVIGLGAIGAMVSNTAVDLGMHVIGYDPYISVDAAWSLSKDVQKAETLESLLTKADYITLHVPQTPTTENFINKEKLDSMKKGVRLFNFARSSLVVTKDVLTAIKDERVSCYVTDFPEESLLQCDKVICLPHLGASTPEAEENCAMMAVKQLRSFLENGNISNSVNFPSCKLSDTIPHGTTRVCISNKNVPNMVGQITTILATGGYNISAMVNQNRNEIAYTMIDIEGSAKEDLEKKLQSINGVINIRLIEG
ncbi:MAG: phosphoglycerate dehydrogenase [Treponemataceae bacterium]